MPLRGRTIEVAAVIFGAPSRTVMGVAFAIIEGPSGTVGFPNVRRAVPVVASAAVVASATVLIATTFESAGPLRCSDFRAAVID